MFRVKGYVVNTVEDLLPIFNENAEVTATALNILGKRFNKIHRQMKMNNLMDLALWISLLGTVSVVGSMLKQMDIQRQRIDILEGLVKDTQNTVYNTVINNKDKDEGM